MAQARAHGDRRAVAYDVLPKENPQALRAALDLLSRHPQYADVIAKRPDAVAPEDRDRYQFMVAARWADDVRANHCGPWHYVNHPIVPPGEDVKPPEPAGGDLLTALRLNTELLAKADASAADRAVALCRVMHLVGDAHQPPHAVALFSRQHPDGDRDGHSFFVRVRPKIGGREPPLALGRAGPRQSDVPRRFQPATVLRQRPTFAGERLPDAKDLDPAHWVWGRPELVWPLRRGPGVVRRDAAGGGAARRACGHGPAAAGASRPALKGQGGRATDL